MYQITLPFGERLVLNQRQHLVFMTEFARWSAQLGVDRQIVKCCEITWSPSVFDGRAVTA